MTTNPDPQEPDPALSGPEILSDIHARRLAIVDQRGDERVVAKVEDDMAVVEVSLPSSFGRQASMILFAGPDTGDGVGPSLGVQGWAEDDRKIEVNMWQEVDGRWAVTVRTGGPDGHGLIVVPRGRWIEP